LTNVQRRLDLLQRRAETIEEPRTGLGWRDTAGGAVEQPDAEPGFEPAHGFAEAGGAAAACPCRVAKAACTGYRDECRQVAKVGRHCPPFRTACADCSLLSRGLMVSTCAFGSEESRS
jgi:hypothetical protein